MLTSPINSFYFIPVKWPLYRRAILAMPHTRLAAPVAGIEPANTSFYTRLLHHLYTQVYQFNAFYLASLLETAPDFHRTRKLTPKNQIMFLKSRQPLLATGCIFNN